MVQKSDGKARGRPRAYDPAQALRRALATFWDAGYAATSLDELSAATGMNRPSLYGAFGDKKALYLKVLEEYRAFGRAAMAEALAPGLPLRDALRRVYRTAIDIYLSGEAGQRGCFLIGTAATESVGDPEVRAVFAAGLHELDDALAARFRQAVESGEIKSAIEPKLVAKLATAVMHTLSIWARAGEKRATLEVIAEAGVEMICGPARSRGKRRPAK